MIEDPYHIAQRAMADLKASVRSLIESAPSKGLTNAQLGRKLGIYSGHVRHEGHISRTILAMLEHEGVVEQDKQTKKWYLKTDNSEEE